MRAIILVFIALIGLSVQAFEPKKANKKPLDPKLVDLINKVDAKTMTLQTLEARFKQRREVSLLKEPVVMEGNFYFKRKSGFKFVFDPKYDLTIVITNEETVSISAKAKRADRVKMKKRNGRIVERLLSDKLKSLTDNFVIEKQVNAEQANGHQLRLIPTKRRVKKIISEIRIWINEQYLINRVEGTMKDGDTFSLILQDIKLNEPIPAEFFDVTIPSDYKVGNRMEPLIGAGATF